jgi:iron(III) transport system substrate-binding protein
MLVALALLGGGCTRGGEVAVQLGVSDAWAGPVLREFTRQEGTQVNRVREPRQADVLWERDLERLLALAAGGHLASAGGSADRIASMVGAGDRWVALSGIVRVLVYDPERIGEDAAPTHLLDLARPDLARQALLADPSRGSAAWAAAALVAAVGETRAIDFYRALLGGGARVVDSEEAVLAALVAGERPLALTDSDVAFAAQERVPRLVILVPDQDDGGLGTLLLPIAVALTTRGAQNEPARALVEHLLSIPVTLRLTLSGNQVLVLHDTNAPAGMLRAENLRLMPVAYTELVTRLPSVRTALARLASPT